MYRSVQGDNYLSFGICTSLVSPISLLVVFVVFFTHVYICKRLVSEPWHCFHSWSCLLPIMLAPDHDSPRSWFPPIMIPPPSPPIICVPDYMCTLLEWRVCSQHSKKLDIIGHLDSLLGVCSVFNALSHMLTYQSVIVHQCTMLWVCWRKHFGTHAEAVVTLWQNVWHVWQQCWSQLGKVKTIQSFRMPLLRKHQTATS